MRFCSLILTGLAAAFLWAQPLLESAQQYLDQGLVLAASGDFPAAEQAVREALKVDPDHTDALTALGKILARMGRASEAVPLLRRVVGADPKSARARVNLGIALADNNDLEASLEEFKRAAELDPGLPDAHYNLGRVLSDLGRPGAARAALQTAIGADPQFAPALDLLAQLEREAGNLERAATLLRQVVEIDPQNAEAHYALGDILESLSETGEAVREWEKAIGIDPDHQRALYRLAQALRMSDPEQARVYNERFLALRRRQQLANRAGTLGDQALFLANKGDFAQAIETLNEAIRVCGGCTAEGLLRKNLGLIYGKSGDFDNAERELKAARDLLPADPEIRRALEILREAGGR